jgi:hypothetical protein
MNVMYIITGAGLPSHVISIHRVWWTRRDALTLNSPLAKAARFALCQIPQFAVLCVFVPPPPTPPRHTNSRTQNNAYRTHV